MTFSPLTAKTVTPHPESYTRGRGGSSIERLIIHHTAGGTDAGNVSLLAGKGSPSSNYCLQTTAHLVGIVPEEHRAWTTGSPSADNPSVTVETVNIGAVVNPRWPDDPNNWRVSEAQLESLAQLAADLGRRYGWGKLDRTRVRGHREFADTLCPGGHLWSCIDWIITRGNELLTPPIEPTRKKKKMDNVCVAFETKSPTGAPTFQVRIFCLQTGDEHTFSHDDRTYIANVAKSYGCSLVSYITESHYKKIGDDLAATLERINKQ